MHDPQTNFEAALFDLDGTLTESEKLLYVAWVELTANSGADFSTFEYSRIIGRVDLECCQIVSDHFGLGKDPAAWHEEYKEILTRLGEGLTMRPGADTVLELLRGAGVKMALVTSAESHHAERSLAKFDFRKYFQAVVTADTEGLTGRKPDPAPYLLGASLIGVDPRRCVAFEDSPSGAKAARAAGCFVIGVPHAESPAEGIMDAHVILPNIGDFRFDMVPKSWQEAIP